MSDNEIVLHLNDLDILKNAVILQTDWLNTRKRSNAKHKIPAKTMKCLLRLLSLFEANTPLFSRSLLRFFSVDLSRCFQEISSATWSIAQRLAALLLNYLFRKHIP
ncbi:hypothetical protein AVEN_195090-1 [Araneus ventricosus]|uniref:Uncharacterized protein n=1 Tax=Araneus ventricosus TaxID=182803 RepID=A0A4Y2BHZ8_ARAVE|nr:hypothetical protein AVEN_195090-1 [Araneus ventricosus]